MNNTIQWIPLDKIIHNRFQQADVKNEAKVLELAASLKQNKDNGTRGLLQVPTARQIDGGKYELAFGMHRNYAFSHLFAAGDKDFASMPLIVRELTDIEMFELMAIENFHRRDIGVIEEAHTFYSYMTTFNKTSIDTARKFEKTEEYVRGSIRLLNLPDAAQQAMKDGTINKSQARDLLAVEKLGGIALVNEALKEITTSPESERSTAIVDTLRMSSKTVFLDKDAGWFASKKFPVKHLPALKLEELTDLLRFDDTTQHDLPATVFLEIQRLLSAGMEITADAFPFVLPEGLERVRVLANPPQCEKCPLHAVMDGTHYCGLPACKSRKATAWKAKELDDLIAKLGVPMYQKADGGFVELNVYDEADAKLWDAKGADLRLLPAQHMWNNFAGLGQNLKAILIGDAAQKRLKKEEAKRKRESTQKSTVQLQAQVQDATREFLKRFAWEVVSLPFGSMLDGITSFSYLHFNRAEMIGWHADDTDFPEGVDEEALIKDANSAQKSKKADGLKTMRRINMFHAVDRAHTEKFSYRQVLEAKKPILAYAKDIQQLADQWDVKLPKDFLQQAEQYQADLDAAIKEIGKS